MLLFIIQKPTTNFVRFFLLLLFIEDSGMAIVKPIPFLLKLFKYTDHIRAAQSSCQFSSQVLCWIYGTNSFDQRIQPFFRKFLQLKSDRLVLCEVALRYWETFDNLFQWAPIPLRTDPLNFRAFETALIQEWQPPLNYPFINQFHHPQKGLLRKAPLSQTTQFGARCLWRSCRWSTTPLKVRKTLQAPTFRNRLKSWTLIHDLGSNTRRSYDTQRFLRSSAAGLNTCYALRRLASQVQEPGRSTALKHLDNCITFWNEKKVPKAFSFRSPWLLTSHLSRTITRFLTGWYHRHRTLAVPCHKPSVKVIYQKHPAVGEFLFTHKKAASEWASGTSPQCTCDLLRQFPEAIIPDTAHIILDASKLTTNFS